MRSKDRLIISAMMIIAFLIVVFLAGFIVLTLIDDSTAENTKSYRTTKTYTSVPVADEYSYNAGSNENKSQVIKIGSKSGTASDKDSSTDVFEKDETTGEEFDNIVRQREEFEEKESEMKEWCDNINSNSCLEMKYTWMDNGCRPVTIECKKFNDDDICFRHEVNIIDKFVDDEYCEE